MTSRWVKSGLRMPSVSWWAKSGVREKQSEGKAVVQVL